MFSARGNQPSKERMSFINQISDLDRINKRLSLDWFCIITTSKTPTTPFLFESKRIDHNTSHKLPIASFLSQDTFNVDNRIHMPIGEGVVKSIHFSSYAHTVKVFILSGYLSSKRLFLTLSKLLFVTLYPSQQTFNSIVVCLCYFVSSMCFPEPCCCSIVLVPNISSRPILPDSTPLFFALLMLHIIIICLHHPLCCSISCTSTKQNLSSLLFP